MSEMPTPRPPQAAARDRHRPAVAASRAQHLADRAARDHLRPRADRGRGDHDVPRLDHHRRGAAGAGVRGRMAIRHRQRSDNPGSPGAGPRSRARTCARSSKPCAARRASLDVRAFSDQESGRLLEPWLGTGLSLNDLAGAARDRRADRARRRRRSGGIAPAPCASVPSATSTIIAPGSSACAP